MFERKPIAGGKARSIAATEASTGRSPFRAKGTSRRHPSPTGRPLPGEHGFRFFPGFYRHVVDTMARIPFRRGRRRQPGRHHGAQRSRRSIDRRSPCRLSFPRRPRICTDSMASRSSRRSPDRPGSRSTTHSSSPRSVAVPDLVRGAPADRVRAHQLVGLHRGWRALAPPIRSTSATGSPARSSPPRRAGPAPRPSATSSSRSVQHPPARRGRRPRAEWPHQRRLDQPLARVSPAAGRHVSPRTPTSGRSGVSGA